MGFLEVLKQHNLWLSGELLTDFDELTADTRQLESLDKSKRVLFFARRGASADGHEFLNSIQDHPSIVAFVIEKIPEGFEPACPIIQVTDTTKAMALAIRDFYGDPTRKVLTVAVTGTNGKTTTTFLVEALLKEMGLNPGRIGTIEAVFGTQRLSSSLTTPDFTVFQKLFNNFCAQGANAFVFEASSHALDQRRLLGLSLDVAIFTNLTAEHLDYHGTMEKYFEAKKKLFSELLLASPKKERWAIVPIDATYGWRLSEELSVLPGLSLITWAFQGTPALKPAALSKSVSIREHLNVIEWKTTVEGSEWRLSNGENYRSALLGRHNIENMMGLVAMGHALKQSAKTIQRALDAVPSIPGRLERVEMLQESTANKKTAVGKTVLVDYAHTADALENVLRTLRPLVKGKLRVVFGCGGDRDRSKRPKMGSIAELYADEVYVTSDNPRTEDPELIVREILAGIQRIKPLVVEVDRRRAIERAVQSANDGDIVLIAGKGHETYQIVGREKKPFDDRLVARDALIALS